jgi:hypothetical protein
VVKPQNKTVMMVEKFVETIEIGNMEHDILETKYVVGGNYFLQLYWSEVFGSVCSWVSRE